MSRLSGAVGRISGYVPGWLDRTTIAQSTLVGIAAVLGSYAVAGFTPALVTAPIESFLVTWMPGVVIRFAITVLGDLGKKLNLVTALGLGIGGFAAVSFMAIKITRRSGRSSSSSTGGETDAATTAAVPLVVGGATLAVAFALTSEVGSSMGAGIAGGAIAGLSEVGVGSGSDTKRTGRRRLLRSGGTLALGGAGAYILGSRGGLSGDAEIESNPDVTQPSDLMEREEVTEGVASRLDEAEDKSLRVRGIEPLVSENFYRTDINNTVPTPDAEGWELSITGAVQFEQTYDFENLGSFDPQHRFISLRCVGENLNGNKMDNAIWTGVPIKPLLEQANPQADFVMAHAVDGYSVGFPREELEGAFLAYGMNGERLPREHGYPVRLLVPGNWGEVNVKWINELEIQDEEENGYWEKKGWKGTGEVKTVAKIKSVNKMNDRVEVAGHAYAGTRGVSAVEVSIDGGDSWDEATLSEPLPGQDVWRQWKHVYYNPGDHEVIARAIEEDGTVQSSEETGPFPSGPSGWVSRSV